LDFPRRPADTKEKTMQTEIRYVPPLMSARGAAATYVLRAIVSPKPCYLVEPRLRGLAIANVRAGKYSDVAQRAGLGTEYCGLRGS
jgi:hypothetical protein